MRKGLQIATITLAASIAAIPLAAQPCEAALKLIGELERGTVPAATPDLTGCTPDFQPALSKVVAQIIHGDPQLAMAALPLIRDAYDGKAAALDYAALAAAVRQEDAAIRARPNFGAMIDARLTKLEATHQTVSKRVSRIDMSLPWLIGAVSAAALCALASGAVSTRVLALIRPSVPLLVPAIAARVNALGGDLQTAMRDLHERFERVEQRIDRSTAPLQECLARLPHDGPAASYAQVQQIAQELDEVNARIAQGSTDESPGVPRGASGDPSAIERDALAESWRTFRDNKDLYGAFENATRDETWQHVRELLLVQLPKHVPDELKPSFDTALAQVRDYESVLIKIALIPRLLDNELPPVPPAQELMRTRELAHLLMTMQSGTGAADRLAFRFKPWISDTFIDFADLYLQRYQAARAEGRHAALEEGMTIVQQVLRVANLVPIDVTLGQTLFDSTHHIGRSAATDTRYPDGVIVAVVRNGFLQGGRDVFRQPEVIVNRMRG